jgi:hypothetical protein
MVSEHPGGQVRKNEHAWELSSSRQLNQNFLSIKSRQLDFRESELEKWTYSLLRS